VTSRTPLPWIPQYPYACSSKTKRQWVTPSPLRRKARGGWGWLKVWSNPSSNREG